MNSILIDLGFAALLAFVQLLAALPWLTVLFFTPTEVLTLYHWTRKTPPALRLRLYAVLLIPAMLVVAAVLLPFLAGGAGRVPAGYVYGAVLQLQLTADFFIIFIWLMLLVWPKGGAVAQAAFREGIRQPMFWLLAFLAWLAIFISPFVPYFTFGEDLIVVKELGYDTIMLFSVVFGCLAASLFVSEEIEGRTALTLMSKPVSRRQFLLGKFVGILLACAALFGFLGLWFEGVLLFKAWFDRADPVPPPAWLTDTLTRWQLPPATDQLLLGAGRWLAHTLETLPGLLLCFLQVMVLVAVSVTLATRLPMVVNLVAVLVLFLVSHLTPVLVLIGNKAERDNPASPVARILSFISQLFDALFPGLEFFRVGPPLLGDTPPAAGPLMIYLASVLFYGVLYTLIVLILGLILFEDRDLA
jgi:ABC-type transport system involved in multi-copper enzyme maturation permease subunit